MAEAVLFGLATDLLKSLATETVKPGGTFASEKIQLLCCAKDELQSLQGTIQTIKDVLLDAEKRQWGEDTVKHWLKRLKDVLYEVQDLLDDVATEDLRRKVASGNKISKEVRIFFSKSNQLIQRLKVANKIQELRKKLNQIANDKNFHLESYPSEATLPIVRRRPTHSFVREEEIIGREEEKRAIIAHLYDSSSSRERVSVISIVGIGGLGKTALAQLVYNDVEVKAYFKLKIWVCVSDVFDEDLIIKDILKSAQDQYKEDPQMTSDLQHIENKSKDQLQMLLRKVLDGKKYLLVLDDLWNRDREAWLGLRRLLMDGSWGSKILVTTRDELVAQTIDAKSVHLRGLSKDKSWDLFKKMALGEGEEALDPTLEEIGREIVQKCAGVPLTIRTIGSLLYKKNQNEWRYFKEHELSKIDRLDDGIMDVLMLSYDHLPSRLKHCFAYCALFPKDFVFDKQTMIRLWMAQGFIDSLDGEEDPEEIGDGYVSDLLSRSLLQVEKVDKYVDEVQAFKMHDLIHDLALKVAGDECKIVNHSEGGINGGIRHASFASLSSSLQEVTSSLEATNVRTFLSLVKGQSVQNFLPNESRRSFSKFRHCRALGLRYLNFCIHASLGIRLKHLRFLDVSGNYSIESLPDSITDLVHLQTLILSGCANLTALPRDLRKLVNLRHLLIDDCYSLNYMPRGLDRLSSLHTLSEFILQKTDHKVVGGVGTVDELGGLNKLTGSIVLRKLEYLQLAPNKGHLKEKQRLRSLKLKWSGNQQQGNRSESDELIVWENLRPHPNLAHLTIRHCMSKSSPSWLSSIRNLATLKLDECGGWKYLPPLSELPSLRRLTLECLDALDFIQEISDDVEQSNIVRPFFPCLEELFVRGSSNLKGWWGRRELVGTNQDSRQYDSQSSFPKLSSVFIGFCPDLSSMPLFPWIEELTLSEASVKLLEQQVMVVPNCPSEAAGVSTFIPFSKLKTIWFLVLSDLEHSMLEILLPFLRNLESLTLVGCNTLRSLSRGMQYLSSLRDLTISYCRELDLSSHDDEHGTQWRSLANLNELHIAGLPKLVVLLEGIQHATTLQSLKIKDCENLMSLPEWIGNFSSLRQIQIIDCPSLICLPDGIHHLTSLKKFEIVRCPALQERRQT